MLTYSAEGSGVPPLPPHLSGLMALASGPKDQVLPSSRKRGQSHHSGTVGPAGKESPGKEGG